MKKRIACKMKPETATKLRKYTKKIWNDLSLFELQLPDRELASILKQKADYQTVINEGIHLWTILSHIKFIRELLTEENEIDIGRFGCEDEIEAEDFFGLHSRINSPSDIINSEPAIESRIEEPVRYYVPNEILVKVGSKYYTYTLQNED